MNRSTLAAFLVAAQLATAGAASAQDFAAVRVGTTAGRPTAMAFAPGVDDQMYIAAKNGRIFRFRDGTYQLPAFLDLLGSVNDSGEGGLLGMVFDPDFETNGYFYVAYTTGAGSGDSVISRFSTLNGDVNQADPASEQILFGPFPQQTVGHKGGDLEFGPDGMLYHSIGDGDGGSQGGLDTAQQLGDPRGKILRLDVNAPHPHIPADNPFVGVAGADERVWALGFRNPYRMEVDSLTGDVYVGDVGTGDWEEVTRLDAATPGANGGWPCQIGYQCLSYPSCPCPSPAFVDPILVTAHAAPVNACAVMGGVVVRNGQIPSLEGSYFFSDFCSGRFYQVTDPAGAATVSELGDIINDNGTPIQWVTDIAQAPDGTIYFATHYGAAVWKLEATGSFDSYCSSTANSSGNVASIVASGSTSLGDGDLRLDVAGLPRNAFGYFLVSQVKASVPNFGGSQGTLCLGGQIYRWSNPVFNAGPMGLVTRTSDYTDLPGGISFDPGSTWNFQYWTRDANPGVTSNTSNGASVLFIL